MMPPDPHEYLQFSFSFLHVVAPQQKIDMSTVSQVAVKDILPITTSPVEEAATITSAMKSADPYKAVRLARSDAKHAGMRKKRADEKAAADAEKAK